MKEWLVLWCIAYFAWVGENSRDTNLLPGKGNIIPEFFGQVTASVPSTGNLLEITTTLPELSSEGETQTTSVEEWDISSFGIFPTYDPPAAAPPAPRPPLVHAGLPRALAVAPQPLQGSDHQLTFNVSWVPSRGPPARDYSLEVMSETNTLDCRSPICYEYDIPGESRWHLIPRVSAPVAETCAIRPGCSYRVRLIAHPWDGHSHANLRVQLDECVAGVCSCGHAPRLPAPVVRASPVTLQGETAINVTWSLPSPRWPLRLPPALKKHYYFVSLGKQMVSDAHPSPWFAHTISRQIQADGLVSDGDDVRWTLLPISERSGERGGERSGTPDVRLLARVSLVDERGCIGPAGNDTAYDPAAAHKIRFGTYALWAALGGACALAMATLLAVSARGVKRVLAAFRPAPVSAPLEPLCRRPAWFPLQLRTRPLLDIDFAQ